MSNHELSLFEKLPFDIRVSIYRYTVADSCIHIITRKDRLIHFACRESVTSVARAGNRSFYDGCIVEREVKEYYAQKSNGGGAMTMPWSGLGLMRVSKMM